MDHKPSLEDRKIRLKALGDRPRKPRTQGLGTFSADYSSHEYEILNKLARGYVFEGDDRQAICAMNAEVYSPNSLLHGAHT